MNLPDPCCYNEHLLELNQVQDLLRQWVLPISETELVPLAAALDRVLACPIYAPWDQPQAATAAMDGYALSFDDAQMPALTVVGSSFAGKPYGHELQPGQAVRIMTGALVPAGANLVVMQERVIRDGEQIRLSGSVQVQQNIRLAGEDQRQGDLLLPVGTWIRPMELALLASIGLSRVQVRRRLKVAYLVTGDELQTPGESLAEGEIYDSNSYMLGAMLQRLGVVPICLGQVADDPAALQQVLQDAAQQADVIISSGGVSVGDADFVQPVLSQLGQVGFWKLAIKPGKPLAFGRIGAAYFFGLPGNPVSSLVTFYQVVRDALLRMMGRPVSEPLQLTAQLQQAIRKKPGRLEFQRGILSRDAEGQWQVSLAGQQSSARLLSTCEANCFIWLAAQQGDLAAGALVQVQPFAGLID